MTNWLTASKLTHAPTKHVYTLSKLVPITTIFMFDLDLAKLCITTLQ